MRKIDAILLSVLVLYDYGAQSLVDKDILNLGSYADVKYNTSWKVKPADGFLNSDNNNQLMAGLTAEEFTPVTESGFTSEEHNISYYDLAKVSSVQNVQPEEELTQLQISVPDPVDEDFDLLMESVMEIQEENKMTFSVETVTENFNMMSDVADIEVKSDMDDGNLDFADTDGDGLYNFEDKCPGVPGVARFEGCPVPDSDGDGINDEEDHCPFIAGVIEANGCAFDTTVNEENESGVEFEEQSSVIPVSLHVMPYQKVSNTLTTEDFNLLLQIADKTIHNNKVRVDIATSSDDNSLAQADTIVEYLTGLGVQNSQISISSHSQNIVMNSSSGVGITIVQ